MEAPLADGFVDVLAEISGSFGLPPTEDCEQIDFNINVSRDAGDRLQLVTEDELTRLFDSGEESNRLRGGIFEAMLPPLSILPDISDNSVSEPSQLQQRKILPASSDHHPSDASKSKNVSSLSDSMQLQLRTLIGDNDRSKSEKVDKDNAKVTKPKHVCHICSKVFKRAHNLKIHGRLHSGAKPYSCPFLGCDKEFRWKSSIVSHMNWHRTKKGDILPGEPEDTSLQAAALRQGTTRRGHGEKRKNKGKSRTAGARDIGGRNLPLIISGAGGASCDFMGGDETKRPSGFEEDFTTVNLEFVEQEETLSGIVNAVKEEEEMGEMVRKLEEHEMGVEMNDLVLEMTELKDSYQNDGEQAGIKEEVFGAVLENEKSFTPSTTATSYDKSPPMLEFDDVVPMTFVSDMDDGDNKVDHGLLTGSELVSCEFEQSIDPFEDLLTES